MKHKQNSAISIILTILVIGILVMSTPVNAITLSTTLPSTGSVDSSVSFDLELTIQAGERIPIDDVTLTLNGPAGLQTCIFSTNGAPVSGCENLSISLSQDTTNFVSSPDRYGNGWNGTDVTNTSFGFGYGFGEGPTQPVHLVWTVAWNTTGYASGHYDVDYFIHSTGGSASRAYKLQTPSSITLSGTASAALTIKYPFPIENNYVFLCEAQGFNATSYDWNFGDGQKLYDRSSNDVYHTYANPGTYLVSCVADGDGTNVPAWLNVNVGNVTPPTPDMTNLYVKTPFPVNNDYVLVCNTTVANAKFDWYYGDGTKLLNVNNDNTFHTYAAGAYTASCTAYNSTNSATGTLNINASMITPPMPPAANMYVKQPFPIGNDYVFVCNNTVANALYTWNYGDGSSLTGVTNDNTFHTYANGNFTATCTAYNSTVSVNASLAVSTSLAVPPPATVATTNITIAPYFPQGTAVVMTCDASFSATTWSWYFDDGSKLINLIHPGTYHVFPSAGTYNVTCKADSGSDHASTSRLITV